MLKQMGIQVWYARASERPPSADVETAPVPGVQPSPEPQPARVEDMPEPVDEVSAELQSPDPISFVWLASPSTLLLLAEGEESQLAFFMDVLSFLDWRAGVTTSTPLRLKPAHFQWPQLLDSKGSPQRALAAFVERSTSTSTRWVLTSKGPLEQLRPWLTLPGEVVELPPPATLMQQSPEKAALWRRLAG